MRVVILVVFGINPSHYPSQIRVVIRVSYSSRYPSQLLESLSESALSLGARAAGPPFGYFTADDSKPLETVRYRFLEIAQFREIDADLTFDHDGVRRAVAARLCH